MLKSLIMLSFCGLIMIGSAFGQAGIRLGMNYPGLSDWDWRASNGFHAGFYYKLSLGGILAIEPGLQYTKKSLFEMAEDDLGPYELENRFNQLDIPVLVRFSLLPFVNVFAGPQLSYVMSSKMVTPELPQPIVQRNEWAKGGVVGVGVSLPFGLNVQGSYDFGMSRWEMDGVDFRNRILKLSVGKNF
ncbi:outer membrane beta-barrel protein [Pararhodonellum marinum]|uniref:outer membrane beta-barrel protein n=1 Tax=Pararhodonellum marinum TaxID=2755358 RepID=UPI00188EA57B|nr:outer membrane beta-barrel protein [Pararhodonellum marinum]